MPAQLHISQAYTQTSAPSGRVVTVAEAKEQLLIDSGDQDGYIDVLIQSATKLVEQRTSRQLLTATWELQMDQFPGGNLSSEIIEIRRAPLASISSVQYIDGNGDTQTFAASKYNVDTSSEPGRIEPIEGEIWPVTQRRVGAVTITFTAGYGTDAANVPDDAKHAIKLLVSHWFENRMPVASTPGAGNSELPFGVMALLGSLAWTGYG